MLARYRRSGYHATTLWDTDYAELSFTLLGWVWGVGLSVGMSMRLEYANRIQSSDDSEHSRGRLKKLHVAEGSWTRLRIQETSPSLISPISWLYPGGDWQIDNVYFLHEVVHFCLSTWKNSKNSQFRIFQPIIRNGSLVIGVIR